LQGKRIMGNNTAGEMYNMHETEFDITVPGGYNDAIIIVI